LLSFRVVASGARAERCQLARMGFAVASWARLGSYFVAEPTARRLRFDPLLTCQAAFAVCAVAALPDRVAARAAQRWRPLALSKTFRGSAD